MTPNREETTPDRLHYVRWGLAAGVVGAATVAIFFLVLDVLSGRALATPSALGASVFLGRPLDLSRTPSGGLVFGYTLAHGAVFVILGCLASSLVLGASRPPAHALAIRLFAFFFVALTGVFLVFALVFDLSIWKELGPGHVLLANLLAAGSMALTLGLALPREWRPATPAHHPG